ncbi:uncharacterized protein AB675_10573 [Cyphellophora attinorum]|uniref:Uncharacterized protein n=1 Tax=Cyphellophora attinorum TaxID=1664694 RepID=A0A0N1HBG6_9EURO|nr:uncharacterized protein AB675_10573 [Phialophora attinorum]KPI40675.1 hypothetical protein AB675_10573 [Phialophora attinorum]
MRSWRHTLMLLTLAMSTGADEGDSPVTVTCPSWGLLGIACCIDPELDTDKYPQYVYDVTASFIKSGVAAFSQGPSCAYSTLTGTTDTFNSAIEDVLFTTCSSQASPEDCQQYATCVGCAWATMVYSFYGDDWNERQGILRHNIHDWSVDLQLGYDFVPGDFCKKIGSDASTLYQGGSADFLTQCIPTSNF